MALMSRRNWPIRSRMRRRSVSVLVSPGPRRPTPPPLPPARPPPAVTSAHPSRASRGDMYSIRPATPGHLPSLGMLGKMSRISAVRSITLNLHSLLQAVNCAGDSSPSQMTVGAVATITSRVRPLCPKRCRSTGRAWPTLDESLRALGAGGFGNAANSAERGCQPRCPRPHSRNTTLSSWRYLGDVGDGRRPGNRRSADLSSECETHTRGLGVKVEKTVWGGSG